MATSQESILPNPALSDPPPYEDKETDRVNEILTPTTLILSGQLVHAAFTSSTTPLYRLNRSVAALSHTDSNAKVQLERLERTVKTNSSGTPRVTERHRHIVDLTHLADASGILYNPWSGTVPPYYLHSVSRRTVGHVGLRQGRWRRRRYEALRVDVSGRNKYNLPAYDRDSRALFVVESKGDEGRYGWSDAEGNEIAVDHFRDGQHTLVITASLMRETMDALVGLWCLRIWHDSAESKESVHTS